jgi:hypothetical protein
MGNCGGQPSLKLQRLQTKLLFNIGNLPKRIPTRDFHVSLKIPYLYDFVPKLCRQQATFILNHENVNVRNIGQEEAQHRNYECKLFKFGEGQA